MHNYILDNFNLKPFPLFCKVFLLSTISLSYSLCTLLNVLFIIDQHFNYYIFGEIRNFMIMLYQMLPLALIVTNLKLLLSHLWVCLSQNLWILQFIPICRKACKHLRLYSHFLATALLLMGQE